MITFHVRRNVVRNPHSPEIGKKLAVRQRDFDSMRSEGGEGNGKWVKTGAGKNQFFIRPGSNKK